MDLSGLSAGGRLFAVALFLAALGGLYYGLNWLVPQIPLPLAITILAGIFTAAGIALLRERWKRQALQDEGLIEADPILTKGQRIRRNLARTYTVFMFGFVAFIFIAATVSSLGQ